MFQNTYFHGSLLGVTMRRTNQKALCHSKRILREAEDVEGDVEVTLAGVPVPTEEIWMVATNLCSVYGLPLFYIYDWVYIKIQIDIQRGDQEGYQ
jgi:hypothetical protein